MPWLAWLGDQGSRPSPGRATPALLATESATGRPSTAVSTFLTDAAARRGSTARTSRGSPTLCYLRPHPPYAAAGEFATMYDPADVPGADRRCRPSATRCTTCCCGIPRSPAPTDPAAMRRLQAQYFGMISEVDAQLGRVWDVLRERGVGRHADRGHRRSRRAARRPRADPEARVLRAELPRRRHRPRSAPARRPRHGRRASSPRTSTCCRRSATRSASTCRLQCDGLPADAVPARRASRRGGATPRTGSTTGVTCSSARGEHEWPWDRRLERQHLAVRRGDELRLRAVRRRLVAVLRPRR